MAKLRQTAPERPLSELEVRFLLNGFHGLPAPLPELGGGRVFEWFLNDTAGAAFARHHEFLHAEAKRLGIRPTYRHVTGREFYYAEPHPPGACRLVTDQRQDEDA